MITDQALESCLVAVQPLRKYAHLPDLDAHEAAQREEWKLELIHRAENYLLTTGTVPPDHFVTMRMHPDFQSAILPRIEQVRQTLTIPGAGAKLLAEPKANNLPLLLSPANRDA